VSDEVNVPTLVESTESKEWQKVHLYNQERMLNQGEEINESLKGLLETQKHMAEFAAQLHENMNVLDETLRESSKTMSGFVTQVVKVPIVIVLIGMASWAFYIGRLSEKGWILILAVAAFPYLGDGIIAIFKIIRGGNPNGNRH
jgi:hypothetical protein